MFDAKKAGEFITNRRRQRGLTQEQLAAGLRVSRQAVSKWERGEAMPDITLLGPLSEALGITSAELIGAAGGTTFPYHNDNGVVLPPAEIKDAPEERLAALAVDLASRLDDMNDSLNELEARLLEHASNIDALHNRLSGADNRDEVPVRDEHAKIVEEELAKDSAAGWERIVSLGRYLSKETLDRLAERLLEAGGTIELGRLLRLAPYLSRGALDRIADELSVSEETTNQLLGFLKYFSASALQRLAAKYIAEPDINWGLFSYIGQYLPKAFVDTLVSGWAEKNGTPGWDCIRYIPHLISQKMLIKLVKARLAVSAPDKFLTDMLRHYLPEDMYAAVTVKDPDP
jgi:transcriptional regulator with XRE-family HTH domain